MAEIIIGQNPGEKSLENFLRLLADGGTSQQKLAAEGAAAIGYLSQTESLPADIQELVDSSHNVIFKMMADGNPQVRQTGMELAWNIYIGSRAARHGRELDTEIFTE